MKRKAKPRFWALLTAAVVGAALSCFGCIEASSDKDWRGKNRDAYIIVGALLPFTGEMAALGSNIERALIMATEELNRAGGIAGREVLLLAEDTHSSGEICLIAARRLIDEVRVDALVGPVSADDFEALLPLIAEKRVVTLSGSVNLGAIDSQRSGGFFFRTSPSNQTLVTALVQKMVEEKLGSIMIFHINDGYGANLASSIGAKYQTAGGEVLGIFGIDPGQKSYEELIRSVSSAQPRALVLLTYLSTGVAFAQALTTSTARARWWLGPTLRSDDFIKNIIPGSLNGAVGVSHALPSGSDLFVSRFRERWAGEAPINESLFFYDSLAILGLAMKAASIEVGDKLPDSESIRAQIRKVAGTPSAQSVPWFDLAQGFRWLEQGAPIDYQGASGAVDLNENGEVGSGLVQVWGIEKNQIKDFGDPIYAEAGF